MQNNLEIILITYNRIKHLENTLKQIFADNSPIKNLDITILDNKSTDGSSELIEEYKQKFPNVKHIRHNKNIGGLANVARAFEIASKEYFWILCDDDDYEWSNWSEVKNAIEANYDMIFTCKDLIRDKGNTSQIIHQATFVPACIYRNTCVSDDVLQNIIGDIPNLFCQTIVSGGVINNNGKIFIPQNGVLKRGVHGEETTETLIRGRKKENVHPYQRNMFWHVGFINSVQVIKDKKLRKKIINEVNFDDNFGFSFGKYIDKILFLNYYHYENSIKNLLDIYAGLDFWDRILFVFKVLIFYTFKNLIVITFDQNKIYFRLFNNKIKTRICYKK